MAWVRFNAAFDWPRLASSHRAYKPGMRCNLPRQAAATAVAEGLAVAVKVSRDQARELERDPFWTAEAAS